MDYEQISSLCNMIMVHIMYGHFSLSVNSKYHGKFSVYAWAMPHPVKENVTHWFLVYGWLKSQPMKEYVIHLYSSADNVIILTEDSVVQCVKLRIVRPMKCYSFWNIHQQRQYRYNNAKPFVANQIHCRKYSREQWWFVHDVYIGSISWFLQMFWSSCVFYQIIV